MSYLIKKLLIALLITLIVGAGAYFFIGQGPQGDPLLIDSDERVLKLKSEEVLVNTKKIRTLDIKSEFFSEPRFTSLKDTRVQLVDIPTGRSNPFVSFE
jgi:hypothetical protein